MSHPDLFDPASRGQWTGRVQTVVALLLALSSPLSAQAPAAPPPAPSPTVVVGRSLTLEYILVVVMIGAALFAVCRSSRRN